jgi:hypothetical protein
MVHINFTPVCSPASPSVMFVYQTTHPVFNVKLFFYFEGTNDDTKKVDKASMCMP